QLAVRLHGRIADRQIDIEVDVSPRKAISAGQPQVDIVSVRLIASPIRSAVIIAHRENALVHILGGEEEAMVVKPKRALKLAKISGNRNDAIAVVRTGCLAQVILIARQPDARHIAPSKGRAPVVVVESSGKMIGVAGAVTLGAIMRIVEMRRHLVAAEPTIGSTIYRQVVIDSGHNG